MIKAPSKVQIYRTAVRNNYIKHSLDNAQPAFNKAISTIKKLGGKPTEKKITKVLEAMATVYNTKEQMDKIALFNYNKSKDLYRYYKFRFIPQLQPKMLKSFRRYKEDETQTLTYNLNAQDQETINKLIDSDITWTLAYPLKNAVSRSVQLIIRQGMEKGLGMNDIAFELQSKLNLYTPAQFKTKFAEEAYWKGVTSNQIIRTKSFQELNQMEEAGVTAFKINTRGEEACPICIPFEGKVYYVNDAKTKMDKYLDYAENGNIDGMKGASDWHSLEESKDPKSMLAGKGQMPPFHLHCYCELEPILGVKASKLRAELSMLLQIPEYLLFGIKK